MRGVHACFGLPIRRPTRRVCLSCTINGVSYVGTQVGAGVISGTAGDDVIIGSSGRDSVDGGEGSDTCGEERDTLTSCEFGFET